MSMNIRVVTPTSNFMIEGVSQVHLRTIEGDITILPKHYPLISAIDVSKVILKKGKEEQVAFASNGIMNVKEDELVLVLNAFEFQEDIDLNRAEKSKERALERINSNDERFDMVRAEASLKRALMRISIVNN